MPPGLWVSKGAREQMDRTEESIFPPSTHTQDVPRIHECVSILIYVEAVVIKVTFIVKCC